MLTVTTINNAKAKEKPYKLADEKGMYLLINATGKYWRMDYRFNDKRKTLALGIYPDVSLSNARDNRDQARKLLAGNPPIDPNEKRKDEKLERVSSSSRSSLY